MRAMRDGAGKYGFSIIERNAGLKYREITPPNLRSFFLK